MIGPDYEIQLPISQTSSYFAGDNPLFTFYPWFFEQTGRVEVFSVEALQSDAVGTRNIPVYIPPGAVENPSRPVHDVIYVMDIAPFNEVLQCMSSYD